MHVYLYDLGYVEAQDQTQTNFTIFATCDGVFSTTDEFTVILDPADSVSNVSDENYVQVLSPFNETCILSSMFFYLFLFIFFSGKDIVGKYDCTQPLVRVVDYRGRPLANFDII